jgi:hypothetical protein
MPWNLLLLNLVAGYYLLTRSNYFKFEQQRLDRQRLIFESILLGVALTICSYLLRISFEYVSPEIFKAVYSEFPIKTPFVGTSFCTILISIILAKGGNVFLDKEKYIKKAIKDVGNEFELLMKSSFTNENLLQFTLDNDKFYVAWVKELPTPSVSNYVRVIPALSGYRNADKELIFTSHYLSVYSEYINEGKVTNIKELNTDLVIDLDNIVTVSNFDLEMFQRFNRIRDYHIEEKPNG